jgi:hypothetical protein
MLASPSKCIFSYKSTVNRKPIAGPAFFLTPFFPPQLRLVITLLPIFPSLPFSSFAFSLTLRASLRQSRPRPRSPCYNIITPTPRRHPSFLRAHSAFGALFTRLVIDSPFLYRLRRRPARPEDILAFQEAPLLSTSTKLYSPSP